MLELETTPKIQMLAMKQHDPMQMQGDTSGLTSQLTISSSSVEFCREPLRYSIFYGLPFLSEADLKLRLQASEETVALSLSLSLSHSIYKVASTYGATLTSLTEKAAIKLNSQLRYWCNLIIQRFVAMTCREDYLVAKTCCKDLSWRLVMRNCHEDLSRVLVVNTCHEDLS